MEGGKNVSLHFISFFSKNIQKIQKNNSFLPSKINLYPMVMVVYDPDER